MIITNISTLLDEMHLKHSESRTKSENLLIFVREWILYEEFYAKGIENMMFRLYRQNESGNEPLRNCYQLVNALAEKARFFIGKLKEEIIIPEEKFITNQCSLLKKVHIDGKKIGDYMIESHTNAIESMNKYYESIQKCEKIALELDNENSSGKKQKMLKKLIQAQKDLKSKWSLYQESISEYHNDSKKYEVNIGKIVDAYNYHWKKTKTHYENSLEFLRIAYCNRFFIEDSLLSKKSDFKSEDFEFSKETFKLPEINLENYMGDHPLFYNQSMPLSHGFSLVETSGLEGFNTLVDNFYKDELEQLINKAWEGEELNSDDYLSFNSKIKDNKGRTIVNYCLNSRRNKGSFSLSEEGFKRTGELLNSALNQCERDQDIANSKNIIMLSQTFYKKNGDNVKEFLQELIVNHSLWKDLAYWEKAINDTLLDEFKRHEKQNSDMEILNHNSFIFYQLVSFGNIMISFKLSLESVIEFLSNFTEKFKFTKNESDELINAITDSIKNLD